MQVTQHGKAYRCTVSVSPKELRPVMANKCKRFLYILARPKTKRIHQCSANPLDAIFAGTTALSTTTSLISSGSSRSIYSLAAKQENLTHLRLFWQYQRRCSDLPSDERLQTSRKAPIASLPHLNLEPQPLANLQTDRGAASNVRPTSPLLVP